ncbi:hypothetical protein [Mycobacterium conspicuum]|uniref:hypothetical protein n=1 Tax=Mycobacterium conspicuum TaxID=44010 RepID=UPI000A155420|nr:hypothetical protein [Mycobacterium conspicuum]ORV38744.1 hypothetical protein AWC00_00465 [Mycobacterium conspicuum]
MTVPVCDNMKLRFVLLLAAAFAFAFMNRTRTIRVAHSALDGVTRHDKAFRAGFVVEPFEPDRPVDGLSDALSWYPLKRFAVRGRGS